MKRWDRFTIVCLMITFLSVAGQYSTAITSQWQTFSSNSGRFSVEMPGAPELSETHTVSFIGTVTNHLFIVLNEHRQFTVDYSDLPHLAVDFAGRDTVYSHTKGALLQKTFSKEQSYEDITVQGIKGKKLAYEMPPIHGQPKMQGQAYLLLDQDRLYVFDAQLPVEDSENAAQRFLSSIRIKP